METDLLKYERELREKGYSLIAGMDEAGRGPLAGPLCVACVVPDLSNMIEGVNDSKKLSEKMREKLFAEITATAICYEIVLIDPAEIDEVNILQATKNAMKSAVSKIADKADFVIIDAVKDEFALPNLSLIHGDALSYSVAAASILAKVTRDRIMKEYAEEFPQFGFEKHKGYGTAEHIDALKKHGACPIHRRTFIKNFI